MTYSDHLGTYTLPVATDATWALPSHDDAHARALWQGEVFWVDPEPVPGEPPALCRTIRGEDAGGNVVHDPRTPHQSAVGIAHHRTDTLRAVYSAPVAWLQRGWPSVPLARVITDHLGLTDAEIGRRVGMHANDWGRYKRGRVNPGADKIAAWCDALGVDVAYEGGRWVVR